VAVNIIQHTDLGTTSTYLQGIDPSEIIVTVRIPTPANHLSDGGPQALIARPSPTAAASPPASPSTSPTAGTEATVS
jgi:hypothetical protein